MPPGEQITFEPAFALVLAEHRIQHATIAREKFVVWQRRGVPLALGHLKKRFEAVGESFVRAEDAKVPLLTVQFRHIAQEWTEHMHIANAARPKERKRDIAKPLRTPPSEKLYLAACGNSTGRPIGDFLMLTMTRYEDQSLWHGNVLRVLSSVVDCTFNPGYVERPSRWVLGGQYNSGFPASRCHISSRIFWRALFAIAPYP